MSFISKFRDATIGFVGYPRLVRDAAGGFGYLSLILAVVMAIAAVISTRNTSRELTRAASVLAKGPDFSFAKGQVNYAGPMPFIQRDGTSVLIVDTTGNTTPEALKGYASGVLVTKSKVYQVQSLGQTRETDLSELPFTLNKADVIKFMDLLVWFVPVGYLFLYVFQLGFKALDAVVLALIAMLYGSIVGRQVAFGLGYKIALYAMTLPIIVQWIVPTFTVFSWTGFFIWWAGAILYLVMGLRAYFQSEVASEQPIYSDIQQ